MKLPYLTFGGIPDRIALQARFPGLHEILEPGIVDRAREILLPAELGDGDFLPESFKDNADFLVGRKPAAGPGPYLPDQFGGAAGRGLYFLFRESLLLGGFFHFVLLGAPYSSPFATQTKLKPTNFKSSLRVQSMLTIYISAVLRIAAFFMPISVSFRAAERKPEMEERKKPKLVDQFPGKEAHETRSGWSIPEKRLRFVDFERIEDNRNEEELSSYELEVKEKLACVPSARDLMIQREEEKRKERRNRDQMNRLKRLVETAPLTPQQRSCYELHYLEKLSDLEASKRLGVDRTRLAHLKKELEEALIKTYLRSLKGVARKKTRRPGSRRLTPYQKEILKLHDEGGLSFRQIARHYGVSLSTIDRIYRRVKRKFISC